MPSREGYRTVTAEENDCRILFTGFAQLAADEFFDFVLGALFVNGVYPWSS